MEGIVKHFNQDKGFGFINGLDGNEYFVHITGVEGEILLNEGNSVLFESDESPKGLTAVNVSLNGASLKLDMSDEDDME